MESSRHRSQGCSESEFRRQQYLQPRRVDLSSTRSIQHTLQLLHALLNLRFQFAEAGEDFARRAVRDFFVNDFLVTVEREVVALRSDVGLGHAETLRSARAVEFAAIICRAIRRDGLVLGLTPHPCLLPI